ncbi:hypothetical protein [Curtobacterium sp. MCBA15_004]|uniref:hypothetical protein n=1 Tax=Curtobacterium sp. MCBA15_004 TaxID=1898733 RepID=UPI0008DC9745|nr:hypothetical protein [Curtobacterium sp. MCBA15_004]WIA98032.1 hypothetical protein QOL16_06495 [Curtobacterium sp. MCBA15_004]
MAAFILGDTPVADFDYDEPDAVDAPGATVAVSVAGQTIEARATGRAIEGSWDTLTLPAAGIYPVYVVITIPAPPTVVDGGNASSTFTSVLDGGNASTVYVPSARTQRVLVDWLVIVDPEDPWHDVVTARLEWDGAPKADGTLHRLLDVARDQVEAYAPALAAGQPFPERYRAGQLMQARNTWSASLSNGEQQVDVGGFTVNVRPLDWAVKQLLRPVGKKVFA